MAANKEIRVLKTNTLEEFRNKTNDIGLHLGDNEQLSSQLADKVTTYVDVSAGANVFLSTPRFEYKAEESVDNTAGYIILKDVSSISGYANGATVTQSGGYSATVVHATTEKILVKNSSGVFDPTEDLSDGSNTIANAKVIRLVAEAYPKGLLRVYKNNVEVNQGLEADEFHVLNLIGKIALTGSPDVSDIVEGTVLNQVDGFQGTVLRARSDELLFKSISGSFNTGQLLKFTTIEEGASIGDTAIASNKLSGSFITYDTARGNAIELNTPAAANDDIKIFSANLVDALNELQHDIGSVESLTTTATTLQGAINEHDAELGTITAGAMGTLASTVSTAIAEHETQIGNVNINSIASGNNTITGALSQLHTEVGSLSLNTSATDLTAAVNEIEAVFDASAKKIVSTPDFTLDVEGDIILDANGQDIVFKDGGAHFGSIRKNNNDLQLLSNIADGDLVFRGLKTGPVGITALTLDMSDDGTAIFNHDIKLPDNGQAIFGDSGDLKIYHDGTKSYISEEGTGGLTLQTDGLGMTFFKSDVSKNMGQLTQFGVTWHYDGSVKFQTKADGVDITGELQSDSLDVDGAGDISGNLAVGGNTTVGGNETITGNLTVNGSTVDINANANVSGTMVVGSTLGVTGVTTLGNNLGVTGNITASGEVEGGSLDINGVADISGNLTIGSLNTSSQHVLGSLNELHTELGDIASLNATFTNDSNLVAALNELQTEVGANSYPAGGPASGLGNVTAAINAINSDIGTTSYSTLSSTISGALAQLHTEVGSLSLDTGHSNLTASVNQLHTEINTNATNIASNDTDIANINTAIGSLGSLTTSVNSSIVNAINSLEDEVDTTQSNIGTINTNIGTIGNLATSAGALVTAINELHGEINSNDSDITALTGNGTTTGRLRLDNTGTQTIAGNISFAGSGKTMTFQTGTTLDLSSATLTLGGGGSTLQFDTAFIELNVDSNQQGLKINRSAITGVGGSAPDAELRWNNGNTKNVGWEVVYPNGADNSGLATSIVTFDNAGNLVDGATETGISVGFASNNFTFAVQVDDSTIEVNGSNQLIVKDSGITTAKINNLGVTTGKIAASAVTTAKIANSAVTNAKLQHDHFTVSDGTNTSDIALNDTLTFSGTSGEVTVGESGGTITIGLPDNVTIAGNLTVSGTTTTLNTANLDIEDKTIRFAKNETTLAGLNGAGLEFGANASKPTILWDNGNTRLTTNKEFHSSVGFNGVGTNLTALNASNIASGTISDARLPATISSNITGSSASCTGNAATATTAGGLTSAQTFALTGDVTGTVNDDLVDGFSIATNIAANTVGPTEMIVGGTAGDGKAIVYQSGAHQYSTISTTDTNTKYVLDTLQSGSNAIIRLTSTGDDAGVTDDITLAAGSNITLTESGDTITIASTQATVNNPAITIGAGALIDVSADNNFTLNQSGAQTINVDVDLTELALETADVAGTDHLVYIDGGAQKKIAFSNVNLSAFDNTASGFTTNTGTVTSVGVGTGLDITNPSTTPNITLDLSELTDLTGAMVGADEFIILDNGAEKKKSANEINLSIFNNNSGFVTSSGVTSVTGVSPIASSGGNTPAISINLDLLPDMTQTWANTVDEFIVLDNGTQKKKRSAEIPLSAFNNDAGFTSNVGDITRVNIAAGTGLTGSVNTASGDHTQTLALDHLGIEDLTDPNADRILFWDDSASATKFLTPGTNISISGTSLDVANTNVTTNLTATQSGNTVTVNSSDGTNATIAIASTTNAGVMSTSDKSKLNNIASSATNTLQPAISSDGSSASLTSGISGAEVRSAIGAGDMTSFTITDPASTNEVVGNGDSIGLVNGSFVNLSLQGSSGSRSIRADLDSSFVSFKTITLENSGGSNIASAVADQPQDTLTIKEGTGISLSSHENDGITIAGQVYSAGNGISLNGSNQFSVSAGSGLIQLTGGLAIESDQRGTIQSIGYNSANTIHTDNGYISFRTNSGDRFKMESDGDFHATGDVVAFSTTPSDERLKENIQVIDGALELVSQLNGVTFDYKVDNIGSGAGVIAQNVEEVLPRAVKEKELLYHPDDGNKYKVVDYNQLSALFIEAIKELKEQNIELKAEVEKLKSINSNS